MTRLCTCLSEHMFPTPHPGLDPFESPQRPPNHPAASTHACDECLMPELGLFPKGPVCGSLCPLTHLPREGSALLGSLGSPTAEHGAHGAATYTRLPFSTEPLAQVLCPTGWVCERTGSNRAGLCE